MSRRTRGLRLVVVGGGITGLSAAHRLQELGRAAGRAIDLQLLEARDRLGGQLQTESIDGLRLEAGADSLIAQKPAGVELCRRVGLEDEIVQLRTPGPTMQIVHRRRLEELPRGFAMLAATQVLPLLRSRLFSWRGKARMLIEPLVPARPASGGDESLGSFVTRRFGREALDRAAEPILAGLFTADADRLSMAMTLPRFLDLERTHGSVLRGLRRALRGGGSPGAGFAWLRDGMSTLVDRLAQRLGPSVVRTGIRIDRLTYDSPSGRWLVQPAGRPAIEADVVILASPSFANAAMLRAQDPELARQLAGLRYASCVTVNLLYRKPQVRHPLRGYGFFVPRTENMPLIGCSYVSRKFHGRVPEDRILLRAFLGGVLDEGAVEREELELAEQAHRGLAALLRIVGEPQLARIHRFRHAMPQFPVGDAERVGEIRQRLSGTPGLWIAGSAVGSIGVPDCIASGERAARDAWELLEPGRQRFELVG